MPTPEANASTSISTTTTISPSSVALRNANITELVVEEADSFKANVAIMTQDQCFDSGHHQANSNIRSSSDKVSDDLNNSKNSAVSNGVSISVQEFNVDVNREYSTDLVIVQNRTVDTDSSPTEEVLPTTTTSKQLTETPTSDCVNSKDILDNNSTDNIDANKSELAEKNIVENMTVITHQNSSENIRDIIANSEKANRNNSSDSQLNGVEKNAKSDINSRNANKSTGTRRVRKLIRSENVNECELDQIEDPIERLNKLRASITSALSEVKGVLKQYSTEQSLDEQNESAPSKQPSDDGPVRFRFVRKIRRRSVFSEDDETEIPKTTTDVIASPIIENKVIEEIPNEFQDSEKHLSSQDLKDQNKDKPGVVVSPNFEDTQKPIETKTDESVKKQLQSVEISSIADTQIPKDESRTSVSETQKTTNEDSSVKKVEVSPPAVSEVPKIKNGKTKKVLKKDRRASIAAVEISQLSSDQPPVPLELKLQRRPSDSGTLVKQTTRVKVKTGEKTKLVSGRKAKSSPSSKKTESSTPKPTVEKTSTTSSSTEEKPSPSIANSSRTLETNAVVIEKFTKPTKPQVSDESLTTQKTIPVNAESITAEKVSPPEKAESSPIPPLTAEVNSPEGTGLSKLTPSKQVTSSPTVSSTVKDGVPQIAPKATVINSPAESSADRLRTPEPVSTKPKSSTVNIEAPETLPKPTEANKSEVASAPEVSTKVANGSQKPNVVESQILKSSAETTKVGIPNQQTAKSKPQASLPTAKAESPQSTSGLTVIPEVKTHTSHSIQTNKQPKMSTEVKQIETSKATTVKESKTISALDKIEANKKSNETETKQIPTSGVHEKSAESATPIVKKTSTTNETNSDETIIVEPDVPIPQHVPKDAVAVKLNLPGQESVEELQRLEEQQDQKETTPPETPDTAAAAVPKKKRKAKRKVVIRRIKRKLSKDDTFLHQKEIPAELEICEKEIEEKDLDEEPEEAVPDGPKQPKSCLKNRQFEIGDVVMYAEHYKKTQVRWKKAVVTERITSISYKLNIEGEERPAHISYIKKFTDRKVNFGGKEYLEIDYAQIEENEEKERNYSIWNLV